MQLSKTNQSLKELVTGVHQGRKTVCGVCYKNVTSSPNLIQPPYFTTTHGMALLGRDKG